MGLAKLEPLEVLVPSQESIVYPGNDAWLQLEATSNAPSGDPAWLQVEAGIVGTPGGTPKVVTANFNAQIDTAQFKFGASSVLFDGVGDYISSPDHSDFVVGGGDFTAEAWVRFSDVTKVAGLLGQWDAAANQMSWLLLWNGSNQVSLATSVNGSTNVPLGNWSWTPNNNQWYHLAIVRSGNSAIMFIDGVAQGTPGTFSGALFNSTSPLAVGGRTDVTTNTLAGWMDEIRFSVGVARYTTTFTPPTAAFATDASTKLLLHCDGADASTSIVDDSAAPPGPFDPGSDPAWFQVDR